jgi:hypothetical protein
LNKSVGLATMNNSELDFTITHPATFIFAGPTLSGKTVCVLNFLRRRNEIISKRIEKVVYVYTESQQLFEDYSKEDPDIVFTKDIKELDNLVIPNSLIVFDDKLLDFNSTDENKIIADWFIKKAHHKSCSVILILQNAFDRTLRLCSINAVYLAFFNQIRDKSTVVNIARQFCPGQTKYLLDAYEKATSKPYKYLFFDFSQLQNNLFRVRNNIFPDEDCEIYVPA